MHGFLLGTKDIPQQTFVKWNDPDGNLLAAINRDGTMTGQGFIYPAGASGSGAKQSAQATHAWIDPVTGGVLIPSAAPVLDTFHYHMSLRIVQLPGPPAQIGSSVIVNAVAVHN